MLAAITSHITDDPNAVHLRRGDFAEGGLPKASMVKMTKLFTTHSSLIVKPIWVLGIEKMEEFLRSVLGPEDAPWRRSHGGKPRDCFQCARSSPQGACVPTPGHAATQAREERLPSGPGLAWSHVAIRFQPREEQIQ